MKKARKLLLTLILAIVIAMQLACGGGDGTVSDEPVVVDNNPTTSLTCTMNPNSPGCK